MTVSGPQDLIVSDEKRILVENGHPLMGRVTGMGCVLTGLIGAFAAVEADLFIAAAGATAFFGLAGERAAFQAKGPGSFKTALLDAVYSLSTDEFRDGIRVKE